MIAGARRFALLILVSASVAFAPSASTASSLQRSQGEHRSTFRTHLARSASVLAALLLTSGAATARVAEIPAETSKTEEVARATAKLPIATQGELHDGDVIYWFGDSNGEWNPAVQTFRIWLRMRFPGWNIQVINASVAGSNALESSWTRLQADLFDSNRPIPTRIFVIFGINDIAWGKPQGKEMERLENYYIQGIERITHEVKAKSPDTQVLIMSYPPVTAPDGQALRKDPDLKILGTLNSDSDGRLNVLTRRGMEAAEKLGGESMDLNSFMRQTMGTLRAHGKPKYHRASDGVHLNAQGADHQVAAILRGLGAPKIVSSITLDANQLRGDAVVTEAQGAALSNVSTDAARSQISFERDDEGLPFVRSFFEDGKKPTEDFSHSPLREFTQYLLKVENLPPGHYAIRLGGDAKHPGREISPQGGISGALLGAGLDLAYMGHNAYSPATPWAVKSRNQALLAGDKPEKARQNTYSYAAEDPGKAQDLKLLEELRVREHDTARKLAQPYPIRFTIERIGN